MCDLTKYMKAEKRVVYKVVLKNIRTGRFWSSAMGFEYPKKGPVRRVRKQKPMTENWNKQILTKAFDSLFQKNMVGRTSGFIRKKDLTKLHKDIVVSNIDKRFEVVKVQVTLSGDLMFGFYGSLEVVAGKFIEKMEEI